MRTKPATRWNAESEHASFGIANWFNKRGIYDEEVIKESMYTFCLNNGFQNLSKKTKEKTIVNFCQNRFLKFSQFASRFLKENNYLPKKILK